LRQLCCATSPSMHRSVGGALLRLGGHSQCRYPGDQGDCAANITFSLHACCKQGPHYAPTASTIERSLQIFIRFEFSCEYTHCRWGRAYGRHRSTSGETSAAKVCFGEVFTVVCCSGRHQQLKSWQLAPRHGMAYSRLRCVGFTAQQTTLLIGKAMEEVYGAHVR
jgi:hypothetical protein